MNKLAFPIAVALVVGSVATGEARADEISSTFETSVSSTYVFRGIPQYNDRTDPSSQTSISAALAGWGPGELSFGVWNATALGGYGGQPDTRLEFDVFAAYSMQLSERIAISAGYTAYLYPGADPVDAAHEVAIGAELSGPVTAFAQVHAEFVRMKGAYFTAGAYREFALADAVSLTPQASVGAASYDEAGSSLNDITASANLLWTINPRTYTSALISGSYQGDAEGSFADRSVVWASVAFGVNL